MCGLIGCGGIEGSVGWGGSGGVMSSRLIEFPMVILHSMYIGRQDTTPGVVLV